MFKYNTQVQIIRISTNFDCESQDEVWGEEKQDDTITITTTASDFSDDSFLLEDLTIPIVHQVVRTNKLISFIYHVDGFYSDKVAKHAL